MTLFSSLKLEEYFDEVYLVDNEEDDDEDLYEDEDDENGEFFYIPYVSNKWT